MNTGGWCFGKRFFHCKLAFIPLFFGGVVLLTASCSEIPEVTLELDSTTSQTTTITNTSDSDLSYEIFEVTDTAPVSINAVPIQKRPQRRNLPLDQSSYNPNEILVKFKAGIRASSAQALGQQYEAQTLKTFPDIGVQLIRTHPRFDAASVARTYDQSGLVEYAEPNYKLKLYETMPNDPEFSKLWGLHNTGQTEGTPDADMDAPNAWDTTTGSSDVIVAVIDTGVDWTHEDLAQNIWTNPGETGLDSNGKDKSANGKDDDNNGYVDDVRGWDFITNDNNPMDNDGHGTHVAGTIGAIGNNGIGVAGVNWTVKIMPLRFIGPDAGSTADAMEAILYAANNGAQITNNSWGGGPFSKALFEAITFADNRGVLFVAAAGNSSSNNDITQDTPSGFLIPNIISVAATDHNDALASFSNYGFKKVHLAAPGVKIFSTFYSRDLPPNAYAYLNGTSMASPHVAGACALVKAAHPDWDYLKIKKQIVYGTDRLSVLWDKTSSGGRLNLVKALQTLETIPPLPITELSGEVVSSATLKLTWKASGDKAASDEDPTRTNLAYDIRYSFNPILSGDDFEKATPIDAIIRPKSPGSDEELLITGLAPLTTYHLVIKVIDGAGNISPLPEGGSVSLTTSDKPENRILFSENTENPQGWVMEGLWHVSTRKALSESHSFYYGDEVLGHYDTGQRTVGTLSSPEIDLNNTTAPALSFQYWREVQETDFFDFENIKDKVVLEVSSDGGISWKTIWSIDSGISSEKQWTTPNTLDLSPYSGQRILLRFTFDSVDELENNFEGFYLDDIQIWESVTDFPWFSVSPISGILRPNQGQQFTIFYDSASLQPGVYQGSIFVKNSYQTDRRKVVMNVTDPDVTAPSAIKDLGVSSVTASSVSLGWTAPGDDGGQGQASSYEVRYSTTPLNSINFAKAQQASSIPTPGPSGSEEIFTISDLDLVSTKYYFAVIARDNHGNVSKISNVVAVGGDLDSDKDGITDGRELEGYLDSSKHLRVTNPFTSDTDGDGVTDLSERIAGTDATNPKSHQREIFKDDFYRKKLTGWIPIKRSSLKPWSISNYALKAIGNGRYSSISPENLDISKFDALAIAFDIDYLNKFGKGGIAFRGAHLEIGPHGLGIQHRRKFGSLDKNGKHHVLLLFKRDTKKKKDYLCSLYIDTVAIFTDQRIKKKEISNNTIALNSPQKKGSVALYDNFVIWPNPDGLSPFEETFDENFGAWISSGDTENRKWKILDLNPGETSEKILTTEIAGSSSTPGFLKHALLDGKKDIVLLRTRLFLREGATGGLVFRGIPFEAGFENFSVWDDPDLEPVSAPSSLVPNEWNELLVFSEKTAIPIICELLEVFCTDTLTLYANGEQVLSTAVNINQYTDSLLGFRNNSPTEQPLYRDIEVLMYGQELPSPILLKIDPITTPVGELLTISLKAIDVFGLTLTYSIVRPENLPQGVHLEESSGVFTWTPGASDIGSHEFIFRVWNGEKIDEEKVKIEVVE